MKRALAILALASVLACKDGPSPGSLNLEIAGPLASRAIMVRVTGPGAASVTAEVAPGTAATVVAAHLAGDTMRIVVIAPHGFSLTGTAPARINVGDVRAAASWKAEVEEVVGPGYNILAPAQFAVKVVRL
jgi:hypothetical protein